jgi:hypothetical protein
MEPEAPVLIANEFSFDIVTTGLDLQDFLRSDSNTAKVLNTWLQSRCFFNTPQPFTGIPYDVKVRLAIAHKQEICTLSLDICTRLLDDKEQAIALVITASPEGVQINEVHTSTQSFGIPKSYDVSTDYLFENVGITVNDVRRSIKYLYDSVNNRRTIGIHSGSEVNSIDDVGFFLAEPED